MYGVWTNPSVKAFDKPRHLTDEKHVNYLPWMPVTQIILCIIFSVYVATMQYLNSSGQESKTQFAVYISDTPLTLKERSQTYNDNIDPKQYYNHAKFQRSCFNGLQEKANLFFFFFKWENMLNIFLEHVQN